MSVAAGSSSELTFTVSEERQARHRPGALPGRVRSPGRAARRRPGLPARPPRRRRARRPGETAGPDIGFVAEPPTPGRYLLYLDFQVDGKVHTAPLVARHDRHRHRRADHSESTHADAARRDPEPARADSGTEPATVTTTDPHHTPKEEPMTASPAPTRGPQHRAGDRRDDLRLLRDADREEAEQARRRRPRPSTTPPRRPRSRVPDGSTPSALIAEVEKTGYTAALPRSQGRRRDRRRVGGGRSPTPS